MSDAENQMLAMLVIRDARIRGLEVENENLRNWIDEKRGFVAAPHPVNCNAVLGVGECDCFASNTRAEHE
jgi:hypothetical protein